MNLENLILSFQGPVATITVNRPKVLNALNRKTLDEFKSALWDVWQKEDCRVLIITGAGDKAFVAGADIAEMAQMDAREAAAFSESGHTVCSLIERMPKAVIAAINGYALGGGCELAMACDLLVASDNAVFGQPEVKLGVVPGFGGTTRLPRLVGRSVALEMIMTGRNFKANDALLIGLVNKVVERSDLMNEVGKLAQTIAENGPLAVATAKRLVRDGLDVPLDLANKTESLAFGNLFATKDQTEGMSAFIEKRAPGFKGE